MIPMRNWLSTPDGLMRIDGLCIREAEHGWLVMFPDSPIVAAYVYEPDVMQAISLIDALYPCKKARQET